VANSRLFGTFGTGLAVNIPRLRFSEILEHWPLAGTIHSPHHHLLYFIYYLFVFYLIFFKKIN